jgi:hypothetical protein
MAGNLEPQAGEHSILSGCGILAVWIALVLLLAPIAAGVLAELIPGVSFGAGPLAFFVYSMSLAVGLAVTALTLAMAVRLGWRIPPTLAVLLGGLAVLALAAATWWLLLTPIGFASVAIILVLSFAVLLKLGPPQARIPALASAVMVIGVGLLILADALSAGA